MRIGVPKEPQEGQTLVAATPDTVAKLMALGYEVVVESGAGALASYPDALYEQAGATVANAAEVWQCDIVTAMDTPGSAYLDQLRPGAMFIARMAPGRHGDVVDYFTAHQVTALAMDAVPRISRAQSLDVLSSMANVGGYRAIIEAANVFGRLFTGQVTAAGKVPPATVYVIGAGVAGLAAIGTANSMGAVVRSTDLRPEVAEQVESMGAEFVPIPVASEESADGYAKEMTADQADAALRLYTEQVGEADIVVTTANIPGRTSPILVTAEAVARMKPGSVIVDMAAANGGNCELTVPGKRVVTDNGVTILGYTDLAGRLPAQASQLYGQNIVNFFKLVTPNKDGQPVLDMDDEVVRGMTVAKDGEKLWPPPPVTVSAAPLAPAPAGPSEEELARQRAEEEQAALKAKRWRTIGLTVAVVLGIALVLATPPSMMTFYIVLALAIVVGFYVITAVTHSLHTPLMSETNAISGIILVGALLQVGSSNTVVTVLAFAAIVVASINIFGGFLVTHRMLGMFRKEGE
ncbi:Re/Si-specific NAD(P)(+) transhydrogenase subunit alpha [Nanchangia anserum]|uniref:NAD(P) transhydrogenase subunit alpha n=1 Tax=Nanchangia anserum TaxID=2692125 RepID=A0A8I0KRT6_9ACTO|nr:Re/Si-specific NAD(P)(+) transhydrogenase subunit alpha [Nanchangia anserum]